MRGVGGRDMAGGGSNGAPLLDYHTSHNTYYANCDTLCKWLSLASFHRFNVDGLRYWVIVSGRGCHW